MKRLAVSVLLLSLLVAPAVQAASNPFKGPWRATDVDGSALAISISGGRSGVIDYLDHYGTICVDNGAPTVVFQGTLTGTISGNTLTAFFRKAHCGKVFFDVSGWAPTVWTYDSTTNTLSDGTLVWHRP